MNKLEAIEQIANICNSVPMKNKGVEICKVLFNQYIFEEFGKYPDLSPSAVETLHLRKKLDAIKIYRDDTGLPLIDCKRAVEKHMVEIYGCDRFPTLE